MAASGERNSDEGGREKRGAFSGGDRAARQIFFSPKPMARPKTDPALLKARGAYRRHPEREKRRRKGKGREARGPRRDYGKLIAGYVTDVISGKVPACKWVKLACRRHVRDLKRSARKSYPFIFDVKAAAKTLARMERFPHIKGRWAARGERIRLEPWQCFVLGSLFGWRRRRDKLRRFREVYIEVPRKNTKSTMAALVGLEMFLDDGEHGAEVYAGATSEKQAHEVFGPAKLMLERSPKIRDAAGAEVWAKSLVKPEDHSRFWPLIGKPGDGASPSCAIVDEYHEHQSSDLLDTMVSGMGAREHALLLVITTAGTDLASPCFDKHREVQKLLEGTIENDELFAIIYGIDDGDDWASPKALRKANPNLGVSVDEDFLLAQQRQAVLNPAYQNRFRTKHLDEWCGASVAGINMRHWQLAADPALAIEQFAGEQAVFSLDLASKVDICAFVQIFKRTEEGAENYYAFGRYYLPEDTIDEARVNQMLYRKWVAQGHLVATDGAEIDFDQIREEVKAYAVRFQVREVVYDPWRATQLAHQLAKDGATVVEMPQTPKNMGVAFDELLSALKAGRFHHDGNPVLEWMASNVIARNAMKGVVVPGKDKPEQKIDGIVAIVMAIARAMVGEPQAKESVYLHRGVLSL